MADTTAKFRERVLLVPYYVADMDMRKMRYHDMLRDSIRELLRFSICKTLIDMIERAREHEIELELRSKRKPE